MKRFSTIALVLLLVAVFSLPASASAATSPGIKPGSFFYFFDTTFEQIGLFFTFNPEKKARKALEYADERLAEAEAVAEDNNAEAVKTAITSYESNIVFAAEKSKEVKDKGQAENLLTSIEDSTSKNQEVLSAILIKVPDEAKEAIRQAIEASKKGQEEAAKQIAELKGEVEQLKQEVAELKSKEETQTKTVEESDKQKSENISASTKPQVSPNAEIPFKPAPPVSTAVDICKNIEGTQTTMPTDMRWDNNQNCVASELNIQPVPIVDLCNNIEGAQSYIPSGMVRDTNGSCVVPPAPIPTPAPSPSVTPAVSIIPSSVKISTNKLNNYGEIALSPSIGHNERLDIIATVKDVSGNPVPNQAVIFENRYSSAKSITDSNGVAGVCFIADSGGVELSEVWYRETSIVARVVIPVNSTFIQDQILVNAPIDQNLKNLDRLQQGHLYEFRCQ